MRFNLAAMTKRARKPRRKSITIREIRLPGAMATDLYRSAYLPPLAAWVAAIPAIMAAYERTLAELATDSVLDIRAELDSAEGNAAAVVLTIRARLERWAAVFEQWHRRRWVANVLSATGVDLTAMIGASDARETLAELIERNVALVKSVSDQARDRIADAVYRGLRERRAAADVARDIRGAVAMGRDRAKRIAADQLVKASSALNDERRRQAGIMAWAWVHSGKLHPRLEHLVRDGKLYSDDPADVGTEYQGKTVLSPPDDKPGELPFCGCTSRAVLIL